MTVEITTIYLLDVESGDSVEAELRDAIEDAQLVDWQTKWQPALIAAPGARERGRPAGPMAAELALGLAAKDHPSSRPFGISWV
jgi:hypothetical protein